MRRDGVVAGPRPDSAEQRFYAVMHHLATVLWTKDLAAEGLAALTAVLEISEEGSVRRRDASGP
jgi:hypothetical protein